MKSARAILSIVCCALLLISLASAQAGTAAPAPERFSQDDLHINSLNFGATQEEAEKAFPEYHAPQTETVAATGLPQTYWYYDGLIFTFNSESKLSATVVSDKDIVGPRGLKVGMTAQEVAALFPHEPTDNSSIFYTSGSFGEPKKQLPPYGYVKRTVAGTFIFEFLAPVEPYGDDVKENPENYVYQSHYQLYINFDSEGKVSSFSMHVGQLAE